VKASILNELAFLSKQGKPLILIGKLEIKNSEQNKITLKKRAEIRIIMVL